MKGVLILAHGSHENDTEKTLDEVTGMLKKKLPDTIIETAYLQFRKRTLETGLEALIGQGVNDILLIPYFLFSGVHIRRDIPEEIDAFLLNRAGVKITMGDTLGADPRLADILADRVQQALG